MDKEKLIKHQPYISKDITIEEDVWIGSSSVIMAGVTIGKGSIIGAGSIVTKDVEPYTINVGSPCKKIKDRFQLVFDSIYKTKKNNRNVDSVCMHYIIKNNL